MKAIWVVTVIASIILIGTITTGIVVFADQSPKTLAEECAKKENSNDFDSLFCLAIQSLDAQFDELFVQRDLDTPVLFLQVDPNSREPALVVNDGDNNVFTVNKDGSIQIGSGTVVLNPDGTVTGGPLFLEAGSEVDGNLIVAASPPCDNKDLVQLKGGNWKCTQPEDIGSTDSGFALDIITAIDRSNSNNDVTLFIRDDGGQYSSKDLNAGLSRGVAIAVDDLDGDGHQDFVLSGRGNVAVFFGNGDGSFVGPTVLSAADTGNIVDVTIADVDVDGIKDIIAVHFEMPTEVSIFHGLGGRSFETATGFTPLGQRGSAIEVVDLDNQFGPDLVIANRFSNNIAIHLNDGLGNFGSGTTIPVGRPGSLAVGDLDNQNGIDIAVAREGSADALILFNDGFGSFPTSTTLVAFRASTVDLADLDNDNDLDVVTSEFGGRLAVFINDGSGNFSTENIFGVGAGSTGIAIGDVNGDGNLDVVAITFQDGVSLLLGKGNGEFDPRVIGFRIADSPSVEPHAIAVADFKTAP